ncbi:haloacid dehalogenase [Cyathus striatus]|nr:haloacid dehalogenase [Cyathus striatus]
MDDVEVLIFDVMGTVFDWRTPVVNELVDLGRKTGAEQTDWAKFSQEWRTGYVEHTRRVVSGQKGSLNVDEVHREVMDKLLESPSWSHLGPLWDAETRTKLNTVWHRLVGWPDSSPALYELQKSKILVGLSNGNMRLLVDMAKHADIPWDVLFSADLFGAYKPDPKTYLNTASYLGVPPGKCAMVAAHVFDLRAARKLGMKTVYVPRPNEEWDVETLEEKERLAAEEMTVEEMLGMRKGRVVEGDEADWIVGGLQGLIDLVQGTV